jgi:thymidylate kinase
VFLGPDGAGKSTILAEIERQLSAQGIVHKSYYFAPGYLKRYRPKGDGSITTDPHNAPINSQLKNLARLSLFLFEFHMGMPRVRRETPLALFDRHMIDMLVDAKRYRMTPTRWWMRLMFRWIPKPDKLVVITAPAATIQARKQEVPFEETVRQLQGYTDLAATYEASLVVENVAAPEETAASVVEFVLNG